MPVTASTVASPLIGFVSIVYVNLSPLSESNATMSPDATIPNFVDNTKSSACGALFPTSTTMSSLGVVSPSSTKSYLISPSNSSPKLFPALSFTDTANLYFPYLVGVSTTWPFESDVHSPTLTKPSSPLSMNQVYFAEASFTPLTLSSVKPEGIRSFNVTAIFVYAQRCSLDLFHYLKLLLLHMVPLYQF